MRKYDVAYVPNGPKSYYPTKELEEMTLEEIVHKHIKTCGKANGNVSVCSQCKSPCKEGKRAIQLLANKVYNDPPIPLYGGKTLIERAREENMKRREKVDNNMAALAKALEDAKQEALAKDAGEQPKKKKAYNAWEGWYETSLASGDQTKWLMDNMHLSKTQAKKKIYQYRYLHGLTKETAKKEEVQPVAEARPVEKEVENVPLVQENKLESKVEVLMKMQDDLKKEMDKYMKLYEEAKTKYEVIKKKTDTLFSAMDILNE